MGWLFGPSGLYIYICFLGLHGSHDNKLISSSSSSSSSSVAVTEKVGFPVTTKLIGIAIRNLTRTGGYNTKITTFIPIINIIYSEHTSA